MIKLLLACLFVVSSAQAEDDFFKENKSFFDEKTDFFAENKAPKSAEKDTTQVNKKFADIEDDDSFFDANDNFFKSDSDFFTNNDKFFDDSDFFMSKEGEFFKESDFFMKEDEFFKGASDHFLDDENFFGEKKKAQVEKKAEENVPKASPSPVVIKISADVKRKFVNEIVAPQDRPATLGFIENNPLDKMYITSYYGMRMHPVLHRPIFHRGIDLRGNKVKIYAVGDGVVSFAGYKKNYGNIVQITHAGGYETRYAHMHRIDVQVGQRVSAKDVLGLVGKTGQVSGPHLHFEILQNGKTLNPQTYLKF